MSQFGAESQNMRLLSHNDLGGYGNGGEGLALQSLKDGRRILYIAHENGPIDFTAVNVTDPASPEIIVQRKLTAENIRSNSLALVDNVLVVAYQGNRPSVPDVGMGVYDISSPETPEKVSFFDTSGPHSRGAHCLWFVDGQYAHLSTGASDYNPRNTKDDQLYMIVDLKEPANPQEAGRWWLPGTAEEDPEPPPVRHTAIDAGFRVHNANVYPEKPDRAYLGYLDGGLIILDIEVMANPRQIGRLDYHPPFPGFTHTAMPLFGRDLLIVTDEAVTEDCSDHPKLTWVVDIREESNPVIISTFPMPPKEQFCQRGGRYGSHNIHENQPLSNSFQSESLIIGAYFNAGVRVHDISDPFRPEEVAFYIPPVPKGATGLNINDVYVDENRIVYAIDRSRGGLYVFEIEL